MIELANSSFEIEVYHLNRLLIPLFSQATKCKVSISNFKLNRSLVEANPKFVNINNVSKKLINLLMSQIDFNFNSIKISDVMIDNWVLTPEKLEQTKFTPILYVDHLIAFLSLKEKITSNFKFLTIFEPITWWFLLILLMIYSIFNIKKQTNFLIDLVVSIINHLECLLTKQSMYS